MDFDKALEDFIAGVNKVMAEAELFHPSIIEPRGGKGKYIALDVVEFGHEDIEMKGPKSRSRIFAFIARQDNETKALGQVKAGDVLKPANYKAPAKHARGNIFDSHNGLMGSDGNSPIQWTGPHYMK